MAPGILELCRSGAAPSPDLTRINLRPKSGDGDHCELFADHSCYHFENALRMLDFLVYLVPVFRLGSEKLCHLFDVELDRSL
jgi:hypothetical protein